MSESNIIHSLECLSRDLKERWLIVSAETVDEARARLAEAEHAARWLLYEWDQNQDDISPILERWPWLAQEGTDGRT